MTRHWLIPQHLRPKVYSPHPVMSAERNPRPHAGRVGRVLPPAEDLAAIAKCVKSLKSRLAFVLISKLYRQMYANTGIATDSARVSRAERWARMLAPPTRRLFSAPPMPELQVPN